METNKILLSQNNLNGGNRMDIPKIEGLIRQLLIEVGEDPDRPGLVETPGRVARMYEEIFSGIGQNPEDVVKLFHEETVGEWVLVRDIPVYSMCEHHLMPFFGTINVMYIPNGDEVIGLSKVLRVVDIVSKRMQLQERLCEQVADALENTMKPKGIGVFMDAEHTCMTMRGIKKPGSRTSSLTLRGVFKTDKANYAEALAALTGSGR